MKQIKGNENKIFFSEDTSYMTSDTEIEFDVKRIQALTFAKLHEQTDKRRVKTMKKIHMRILIAAAVIVMISGTVWAGNYSGLFANLFDNAEILKDTDVLAVGDFVENEDVKITVQAMVSDGYHHMLALSAEPKTETMKHIFEEYAPVADIISVNGDTELSKEDMKRFSAYGVRNAEQKENGNFDFYITLDGKEQINEIEIGWAISWAAWGEWAEIEPLEIKVSYQNTIGEGKHILFPEGATVQEFWISALGGTMISNVSDELTSIVLVWKDGSTKILGTIVGEHMDMNEPGSEQCGDGLVASVGIGYHNEGRGEIEIELTFTQIVQLEELAGVQINGVLYPFVEGKK